MYPSHNLSQFSTLLYMRLRFSHYFIGIIYFRSLLAIVLFLYLIVAYRNPGFVEQPIENVVARDNNTEIKASRKKVIHQKYLSTENDDQEIGHEGIAYDEPDLKMEGKILKTEDKKLGAKDGKLGVKEEIVMIETRFCTVCFLEQPLRAKHCRECGKCVAVHDHHCPWVGLCIGEKNRFYFWWYLFFQCILLWVSAALVVQSFNSVHGWQWVKDNWGKIPILLAISFFIVMVTCLFGYHSYLALTNQTTWENVSWEKISYMRQFSRKDGSPFSKGILLNVYYYCCKKYPDAFTIWQLTKKTKVTSL